MHKQFTPYCIPQFTEAHAFVATIPLIVKREGINTIYNHGIIYSQIFTPADNFFHIT
jgi:hypothetical protein